MPWVLSPSQPLRSAEIKESLVYYGVPRHQINVSGFICDFS